MKIWLFFTVVMLFATLAAGNTLADINGVKHFACIEMRWLIPDSRESVYIEFIKDEVPFGQLSLDLEQPYRQFSFSTDAILAQGRIRLHIDQKLNKGTLKLDSFSYRCYAPEGQTFYGQLEEFELPQKP